MHDPEGYRRELQRLRAEIEARRTPEQKAKAERIRAQRAAYEAMPNARKTEKEELEVFRAFVRATELEVDSGSEANGLAPEPDIRCTMDGRVYYFELGEIADQPVARAMANALKHDEPRGTAYSESRPFAYIIGKKRSRSYTTKDAAVDLVLYYRTQPSPTPSSFGGMLAQSLPDLLGLTTPGPFQRVWIFDFNKQSLLWRSDAVF